MTELRKQIAAFRKEAAISQKQLAESIGVRPATISDFENGKSNLGSDKLKKIMQVLNLTLSKQPDTAEAGGQKENKTCTDVD